MTYSHSCTGTISWVKIKTFSALRKKVSEQTLITTLPIIKIFVNVNLVSKEITKWYLGKI